MSEISVCVRQANGALTECAGDEDLLLKCRTLLSQGVIGRDLIGQIVDVDPAAPPLSLRLFGIDALGKPFEEFICY